VTAWDTCTECGKPTTSGLLICYACASRMIEAKKKAGVPIHRVVIDGNTYPAPADSESVKDLPHVGVLCPACMMPARISSLGSIHCRNCGFKDGET
jgi:hypothetical protein